MVCPMCVAALVSQVALPLATVAGSALGVKALVQPRPSKPPALTARKADVRPVRPQPKDAAAR